MTSLIRQIALVNASKHVKPNEFLTVSAAIQKQVTRDLAPIWEISATIDAFLSLEEVPVGYWPVIIVDDDRLPNPNLAGVHEDNNGQPFALLQAAGKKGKIDIGPSLQVTKCLSARRSLW